MEEQKKDVLILAIETSCDETSAACCKKTAGKFFKIQFTHRLNCIRCLVVLCRKIASRKHIEKINIVIETALKEADVTLEDIDAISGHLWSGISWCLTCRRCRSQSACLCSEEAVSWCASYRGTYQCELH